MKVSWGLTFLHIEQIKRVPLFISFIIPSKPFRPTSIAGEKEAQCKWATPYAFPLRKQHRSPSRLRLPLSWQSWHVKGVEGNIIRKAKRGICSSSCSHFLLSVSFKILIAASSPLIYAPWAVDGCFSVACSPAKNNRRVRIAWPVSLLISGCP